MLYNVSINTNTDLKACTWIYGNVRYITTNYTTYSTTILSVKCVIFL